MLSNNGLCLHVHVPAAVHYMLVLAVTFRPVSNFTELHISYTSHPFLRVLDTSIEVQPYAGVSKHVLPCLPEIIPIALKCRHFHTAVRWCSSKRGFTLCTLRCHVSRLLCLVSCAGLLLLIGFGGGRVVKTGKGLGTLTRIMWMINFQWLLSWLLHKYMKRKVICYQLELGK